MWGTYLRITSPKRYRNLDACLAPFSQLSGTVKRIETVLRFPDLQILFAFGPRKGSPSPITMLPTNCLSSLAKENEHFCLGLLLHIFSPATLSFLFLCRFLGFEVFPLDL